MSVLPGFCGEIASVPYRVFLGAHPTLSVEQRFLRQLQPVFHWYTSRKRVKEQANEFMEIDLASCDPELMLRYSHVYYVRRQLYEELIDRQLTLVETGKSVRLADSGLLSCLTQCNADITRRHAYEMFVLQQAKRSCNAPNRRELDPGTPLEAYDLLAMMRVVEEDVGNVIDAEMQARPFLPQALVEAKVQELSALLLGPNIKKGMDRKEARLLQRMIPSDYATIGCVAKFRPVDVTTLYRYVGQRTTRLPADHGFKRSLYAHTFRKFATHPHYLRSISMYWARHSGMDPEAPQTTMPKELAEAVCVQQNLFPAVKFRSQYLYTSPELARQQWRTDGVVPLMRLFPTFGQEAAEDLAAAMVVESEWSKLQLEPETSPLQESVVRSLTQMLDEVSGLYDSNREALWKRVVDGTRIVCPPLSEEELRVMVGGAEASPSETSPGATVPAEGAKSP